MDVFTELPMTNSHKKWISPKVLRFLLEMHTYNSLTAYLHFIIPCKSFLFSSQGSDEYKYHVSCLLFTCWRPCGKKGRGEALCNMVCIKTTHKTLYLYFSNDQFTCIQPSILITAPSLTTQVTLQRRTLHHEHSHLYQERGIIIAISL